MADRIRAHAWAATELGPIEQWPPELLTIVNLMLASRDIMTVFWRPDRLMLYNDHYVMQLGDRHPMLGRPLREVWPDVVDQVAPFIDPAFQEGRSSYLDDSPLTVIEDGEETQRFYTASFEPIWVRRGEVMRVEGVYQTAINNTAKVEAQQRLRESEARAREAQQAFQHTAEQLALAVEAGGLAAWYYDPVQGIVGGDAKMAELFGVADAKGPAEVWIAKIHPDDQEHVAAEFAAALTGAPYETEFRVCNGSATRWIRSKARQVSKDAPQLLGICEDVTERKIAETALQRSAERLHLASSTGRITSWDWNQVTGEILWNEPQWSWNRPESEVNTPEECFALMHPDDAAAVGEALQPALQGYGEYQCEFRVLWPDGSVHWNLGRGQGVSPDAAGKPTRVLGVNLDITERKLAELALLQNEKLAAVGRLASSIAHEINNPLESVTNLIFLARSAPETSPETQEYLDVADRELRRASNIVSQTLRFHKQASRPTRCIGEDLFRGLLTVYQGRIVNARIQVEERYEPNAAVPCLEGEVRQVLSNLVSNAIDAMPTGGRLLLRSRNAQHPVTGVAGMALLVADTGTGMPAAVRQQVFDAFFTTKGIGGTGLGLWVSKEIVERHHGTLRVRSTQRSGASGTVFRLFLPEQVAQL